MVLTVNKAAGGGN